MLQHPTFRWICVGLLLAAGGTLVEATCHAGIVFSDNFNAGASAAWGNERGNWRAVDGVYDATNPSNNPLTYSSVTTLPGLTDFAVDVDVNDLDDGGVWLRSNFNGGSINGVLLVTGGSGGSNNGFYWHVVQNGSAGAILGSVNYAGAQGNDFHLRIEVIGNTYSLFVNGAATPLTSITSSTYASGRVGLYDFSPTSGVSTSRGQTFDNFQVTDLTPVPEPSSLALLSMGALGLAGWSWRLRTKPPRS